jgi:large conductance mechanosensitive channel
MPPIGLLLANVNFSNLYVNLSGTSYASLSAAQAAGAPTLNYGTFITALINFLIIGLVLFLVVRQVNRMNRLLVKQAAPAAPTTKECPYCRTLIPLEATRCPNCTSELP